MTFECFPFRFHFSAKDSLYFPPGKSGNVVRGAFGTIFRRIACIPGCRDTQRCEIKESCPYARIFEPQAAGGKGPSGLADWPRPFVFRAWHLDGRVIEPGEAFSFDVHVFDVREPALPYFVLAFSQLAREGLGPRRGRAELTSVERLGLDGADSAVVSAVNTKVVTPKDFLRAGKAVAQTANGRKAFFRAYELRMDTLVTHPLFDYRVSYRRLMEIQARLLARYIEGEVEEYPVFVTR